MRRYALAAVFLLPLSVSSAATISGTVRDPSGNPIPDARIDHVGGLVVVTSEAGSDGGHGVRTDSRGYFRVTTSVPVFVIRKPGFHSQRLQVTGDADLQVALSPVQSLGRCQLPNPPKFKTKSGRDIDYRATRYIINTRQGRKGIVSGAGALYTLGAPSKRDIEYSTEYSEFTLPNGVIDAAGRKPNGTYWRSRSILGKAAHYDDQTRDTANKLDCIMDRLLLTEN
jgi:hypothetical protein